MLAVEFSLPFTDPIMVFGLAMIVFLTVPLLLARYRIPGIIGIILVGALIGPNALHLLQRGETIQLLGQVGLVYLMFVAGLEINLNQFIDNKDRSITFGLLSFLIPQIVGTLAGVYLLGFSVPAALLFASVFASHTLLAYPVVNRLGIVKNESVMAAIGGTILTDTLALLVLAVVIAMEAGALSWSFWVILAGGLALFFVGTWILVPRLGRWFFRNVSEESYYEFLFVMAVLFVCSYLAEVVGVEAIVGAFLAGLVLNRLIPGSGTLMNRIEFVGNALFIPFFLLSVGMLVDFRVLVEGPQTLLVAGALIVLVFVTKLVASWATAQWYHYTFDEMMSMFGLSVGQAAAALAIVLIGYDAGLFGEAVLNATVLMILATAVLSPWLVERYGRQVALQEEERPYEPSSAPQRILIPLSNPETAEALVDLAILMRAPVSDQPIYPATVVRDGLETEARVAEGEKLLGHAVVHAAAADVPVVPITRIDYNIAHGIMRAIKEERISTVIIGWGGHSSARRVIFGSVLDQLLDETEEMVIVSKIERPLNTHRRVLVAVPPLAEREPGFGAALRALKTFASQTGEELIVLAAESSTDTVMGFVQQIDPEVPFEVHELPRWAGLAEALDTLAAPVDLIVLISERKGSLAWRPSLDRLPGILAQRFDENSLLTIYMSERPVEALPTYRGVVGDRRLLVRTIPEGGVVLGLDEAEGNVLEHVLERALRERPESVVRIASLLAGSNSEYAPEVMPGVALYHAHTDRVNETLLLVGISREGVQLPSTSQPVYVVLVLLGSRRLDSEAYLRRLTAAADVVHTPEMVEALRTCETPEDVRALLSGRVRASEVG